MTKNRVQGAALLIIATIGILLAQSPKPKPAFPGQTEAPLPPASAPFQTQIVTERLNAPWSLAFLPDGSFLVTENGGSIRVVKADGTVSAPIEGVPGVRSVGAEGLHEVVLDPDFARNRMIYFTYLAPPVGEQAGAWPLEIRPTPMAIDGMEQAMQWHKFRTNDPGLTWLRGLLVEAAKRIDEV